MSYATPLANATRRTRSELLSIASLAALIASACGSNAPTPQLVDARKAYSEARASEAASLTPDKLLTAEQALARAEAAYEEDEDAKDEAHLAYLASRKAYIAMAFGKIVAAKEAEAKAQARYVATLEQKADNSDANLTEAEQKLANERAARTEAETRAAAALASLAEVAKIKEEQRGMVITLPGGVLFPSGGSQLSPSARQALEQVATALTAQPTTSKIVVEGHTDDRGSDETNSNLSRNRAEAVRGFLVERGVPSDRIAAVGKGESTPIAPNESAEGRATNRRVELIVSNPPDAQHAGAAPAANGTTGLQASGQPQPTIRSGQ